jgi:hypothetical protein
LGMKQKHILFPCPGIFQPPSLPQKFPLLLTSPFLPPPSYLPPTYLHPHPTSLLPTCTPILPPSPHFPLTLLPPPSYLPPTYLHPHPTSLLPTYTPILPPSPHFLLTPFLPELGRALELE